LQYLRRWRGAIQHPQHTILDNHIVLCGDVAFRKVSRRASSLAGILVSTTSFSSLIHNVTLDAMLNVSQSEMWRSIKAMLDVQEIDGHNMEEILAAYERRRR